MPVCRHCFEAWKTIPGTIKVDMTQDMSQHNCQQAICNCPCKATKKLMNGKFHHRE